MTEVNARPILHTILRLAHGLTGESCIVRKHNPQWIGFVTRLPFAALTLAVAAASALGQEAQPSLGELARRQEAQRKSTTKPSKIYTNADLYKLAASDSPTPTTTSAPEESATRDRNTKDSTANEAVADPTVDIDRRLALLRRLANDTITKVNRYNRFCAGQVTAVEPSIPPGVPLDSIVIGGSDALVSQGVLLPPGTGPGPFQIQNETTPECRILRDEVVTARAEIAGGLKDIDEDARRRGVLPGVLRDLFKKHGF